MWWALKLAKAGAVLAGVALVGGVAYGGIAAWQSLHQQQYEGSFTRACPANFFYSVRGTLEKNELTEQPFSTESVPS